MNNNKIIEISRKHSEHFQNFEKFREFILSLDKGTAISMNMPKIAEDVFFRYQTVGMYYWFLKLLEEGIVDVNIEQLNPGTKRHHHGIETYWCIIKLTKK